MSSTILDKFRGTLVGALVGDCTGYPFEFALSVKRDDLQEFFDSLENGTSKYGVLPFTDDSAMTIGIAESFVQTKTMDPVNMAKRFVTNYFNQPERGYGMHVQDVFAVLKETDFSGDVFKHATLQFEGTGSWGNGGAMRVSAVPLFCYSNYDMMLEVADKCTRLTHTHKLGIDGALLQAICVYKCLHHNSHEPINVIDFVQDVIMKMKNIELYSDEQIELMAKEPAARDSGPKTYLNQLNKVLTLLRKEGANDKEVKRNLGNASDESALYSVPTALYCFLRAQRPIQGLETDNVFRRIISYCISLGGDTDTIASMAGAMCGAYLGLSCINNGIQGSCEGVNQMIELAEGLHSIQFPPPSN